MAEIPASLSSILMEEENSTVTALVEEGLLDSSTVNIESSVDQQSDNLSLDTVLAETADGDELPLFEKQEPSEKTSSEFEEEPTEYVSIFDEELSTDNLVNLSSLKEVTREIRRAQRSLGSATALYVCGRIFVGTSRGFLMVFDYAQNLEVILENDFEVGSVVCIHSRDGVFVSVGHESGEVALWDAKNAKLIRSISANENEPVTSVAVVSPLEKKTHIVLAISASGVATIHTIKQTVLFTKGDTKLLLDGKAGTVADLKILPVPSTLPSRPAWTAAVRASMFAFATAKNTYIASMFPAPCAVRYTLPAPAAEDPSAAHAPAHFQGALPCLAWRPALFLPPKTRATAPPATESSLDPLLAVARNNTIQLLQVFSSPLPATQAPTQSDVSLLEFVCVGEYKLDYTVISIAWLAETVLLLVLPGGKLTLFDPFTSDGFPDCVCDNVFSLVNHTLTSSLPDFSSAVSAVGHRVFLAEAEEILTLSLLTWSDRIDDLIRRGRWHQALALAVSFYSGRAVAPFGLPREIVALREITTPRLTDLIHAYTDMALASVAFANGDDEANPSAESICQICMEYCLRIENPTVLFNVVYQRFAAFGFARTFFDLLTPSILSCQILSLTPEVVQAFVEHHRERGNLDIVEQCLLLLKTDSFDVNQVVRLCRAHHLWRGLVHVFTKGMLDYMSPFAEMFSGLMKLVEGGSSGEEGGSSLIFHQAGGVTLKPGTELSNVLERLLGYAESCMNGNEPFETTPLSPELASIARGHAANFLFRSARETGPLPAALAPLAVSPVPAVSLLFLISPQRTLALLSTYMTKFKSTTRTLSRPPSVAASSTPTLIPYAPLPPPPPALVVDSLFQDILDKTHPQRRLHANALFTPLQALYFQVFVAEHTAEGTVTPATENVRLIVADLMAFATGATDLDPLNFPDTLRAVQAALSSVLRGEDAAAVDLPLLAQQAERAQLFSLSEQLYSLLHDYPGVLRSHLSNSKNRTRGVFNFIRSLQRHSDADAALTLSLKEAVVRFLPELLTISGDDACALIIGELAMRPPEVLRVLAARPLHRYQYLSGLVASARQQLTDEERPKDELTSEMLEMYVDLACVYSPHTVLKFLQTNNSYRLDKALDCCDAHNVADATAFLLERMGDYSGAVEKLVVEMERVLVALLSLEGPGEEEEAVAAGQAPHTHTHPSMPSKQQQRERTHTAMGSTPPQKSVKAEPALWARKRTGTAFPEPADTGTGPRPLDDESKRFIAENRDTRSQEAVLQHLLGLSLSICCRSCRDLEPVESQALFFSILELMFTYQKHVAATHPLPLPAEGPHTASPTHSLTPSSPDSQVRDFLGSAVGEILRQMLPHVGLAGVVTKIVEDYSGNTFGEFKDIILGMLNSCEYEETMLTTTNSLLSHDVFRGLTHLRTNLNRGFVGNRGRFSCFSCGQPFTHTSRDEIRLFSCQHCFHTDCMGAHTTTCPVCTQSLKRSSSFLPSASTAPEPHPSSQPHSSTSVAEQKLFLLQNFSSRNEKSRFSILQTLKTTPLEPGSQSDWRTMQY